MDTFTIIVIAPTVVAALVLVAAWFRGRVTDVRSHPGGGWEIDISKRW